MKTRTLLLVCALAVLAADAVHSQSQVPAAVGAPAPRTITVTATSEVEVVPDQAVLSISLSTFDKNIAEGKVRHDQRAKELQDLAAKEGVQQTDIQASKITIWTERSERGKPRNIQLTSTMTFRVRNLTRYDELLTALLNAGVESIQSVEFSVSDPAKHRAHARLGAVRAAMTQADAMAKALGQKLGQPLSVVEMVVPNAPVPSIPQHRYPIRAMANYNAFEYMEREQVVRSAEAVAAGQIVFRMSVTATFELN